MRKIVLAIFCALTFNAFSQITILRSDFGSIGDKVKYAVDTPASASLNSTILITGASKTWDFSSSGLIANKYDSNIFVLPSLVSSTAPPSANIAIVSTNNIQYDSVDQNYIRAIFDQPQYNLTGLKMKVFKFPFTYLSLNNDSLIFTKKGVPSDFNLTSTQVSGADSVRFDIRAFVSAVGEGWGTLTLPDTSCAALKVRTAVTTYVVISAHLTGIGWLVAQTQYIKQINIQWMAKNSKSFLAQASMDTTNGTNVLGFTYFTKKVLVPSLKAVTPNTVQRGQRLNVTISASNTHFTQASNIPVSLVSGGTSALLINSVNILNDSMLTANITITQSNLTGAYNLNVTDPVAGNLSLTSALTVTASSVLPSLTAVTPGFGDRKQTLNVMISGSATHFTQGSPVINFYLSGNAVSTFHFNTVSINNDSSITCGITIDSTASVGVYDVKVSTLIDGTLTKTGGFSIMNTGINEVQNAASLISVYPNPANEFVTVSMNIPTINAATYQFFDLAGRLVKSGQISGNNSKINISDITDGIYFCTISGKDFITTKKIVISK